MVVHPRCVFKNYIWLNQLSNTTNLWWIDGYYLVINYMFRRLWPSSGWWINKINCVINIYPPQTSCVRQLIKPNIVTFKAYQFITNKHWCNNFVMLFFEIPNIFVCLPHFRRYQSNFSPLNLYSPSYSYWTVHHLTSWIIWTNLMSLYESFFLLLNMFRMLLHSSSGAGDCI